MTARQLRNSILQMAVQGKLVPQNPDDEPASVLLAKIGKERKRLVKEGKIKADKVIYDTEKICEFFDLPPGWTWCRLGEICIKIGSGSTPRGGKNVYVSSGIPFLRSQNIKNNGIDLNDVVFITPEIHSKMKNTEVMGGDILLNITGASLGRCSIVPDNFPISNVSQHVTIIRLINKDIKSFIHTLLLSPFYQNLIWTRQVGMAREGLSKRTLEQFEILLPPLAEQKRITAKLKDIYPDLNNYEQAESALIELNSTFPANLKKSILQEAVRGKLVPQDPNDEPASELLKRIRAERKKLIAAGKIKKPKMESHIFRRDGSWFEKVGNAEKCIDAEIPFEIPDSWEWTRLGDITIKDIKRGKSPVYSDFSNIYVFAQKCNVKNNRIDISLAKYLDSTYFEKYSEIEYLVNNDIIINSTGDGTLGRVGIFQDSDRIDNNIIVPDSHVTILRVSQNISRFYCYIFMLSIQAIIEKLGEGTTKQTELKPEKISRFLIPLPPLNEQHRIAAKIGELFANEQDLKKLLQ